MTETMIRVPRMHALPWQMAGPTLIWDARFPCAGCNAASHAKRTTFNPFRRSRQLHSNAVPMDDLRFMDNVADKT
jgi:hypothetical protein